MGSRSRSVRFQVLIPPDAGKRATPRAGMRGRRLRLHRPLPPPVALAAGLLPNNSHTRWTNIRGPVTPAQHSRIDSLRVLPEVEAPVPFNPTGGGHRMHTMQVADLEDGPDLIEARLATACKSMQRARRSIVS